MQSCHITTIRQVVRTKSRFLKILGNKDSSSVLSFLVFILPAFFPESAFRAEQQLVAKSTPKLAGGRRLPS
ncbi:hypothetical protein E5S67_05494 [Microcoleus sp. IPMA8]|uniref:Uncharacterized protein n=1 Tax=Microcoleus asticus IPMA8 TaxID=2563858 RepID=A0ABX2D528_9CYAN|nr:hypothetical protein [Microcoleus asticus IPMA8]